MYFIKMERIMYSTMGNGTGDGSIYGTPNNNPYGTTAHDPNAPAVGVAPAVDPHANVGVGHSLKDEGKSNETLYNEYLHEKANLESRYPEAAKNLSMIDPKDPNAVLAARDKAVALRNEEEGKDLQKKLAGGIGIALAGGAALFGMNEKDAAGKDQSGKDQAALALGANGNEKGKDNKSPEEHKTVKERFAEMLADFSNKNLKDFGVSEGKDVPDHNSGLLAYSKNLPLVAAENKGKQEILGRFT
jgi:hypothetical protein